MSDGPHRPAAFDVRVATRQDVDAVSALYARSYPKLLKADYPPSLLVTVVPMFSKAQPRLVTSGTFFVAETADGNLIGAGGWTPRGPMGEGQRGVGHIRHFATDPDVLRQGVAGAIMARCVQGAKQAGMLRLACYSTRTAVPFYAAQGFRKKGDMSIAFRPGIEFPVVVMERSIL